MEKNVRQPLRLRLPIPIKKDVGLGDVVKGLTAAVGIKPCGGCNGRAAAPEEDVSVKDPSQARLMRRDERFDRLQEAFRQLSPEYRQVISLARIEGLGLKDVAQRMGRSHAAARKLLCRALRSLKESFGDTESLHLPARHLEESEGQDDE